MERTTTSAGWSPATVVAASAAPTLGEAALVYVRAGAVVFPCRPEGKAPLTRRGFHEASRDEEQVAAWWRRWPEANIGLPTGAMSGVDVVDVDVHDGGSGFGGFERARRAGLVASWACLVRTPSGGVHAYFPHGLEQRSWTIATAHVDFRGDGGYVVVPPSRCRTADRVVRGYELLVAAHHESAPVDAAALRGLLVPPRRGPVVGAAPVWDASPRYLAEWVAARPEGGRNGGLFWAACRMVEGGFDRDSVFGLLGEAAERAGLGRREATATISSAFRRTGPREAGARGRNHSHAQSRSSEAVAR
ncbi:MULTISPECIES: bifunctional DNA primase/polymerase [unclassified Isoptericola]|uniref:bifunctional DNA primase/polymerase n=1 Tax=unclassified Isoptericola TaxID=2623355 RepID=UPI0036524680